MNKKIIISFLLVGVFVFVANVLYSHFTELCEYFNASSTGIVNDLRYNTQKLVEIKLTTSKNWIYLGTNIVYDVAIEKGDSIYKTSRNYKTIIVKKGRRYDISSNRELEKYFKYCKCN